MLGQENVATPLLSSFGERFGLEDMLGKRAAIVADARLGDNAQPQWIKQKLLPLIADDAMRIDRKHLPALSNVQMGLLITMCSNDPLRIEDASGAFASRFICLRTVQRFLGREDRDLEGKLMAELPGVLNWALRGLIWEGVVGLKQPEVSADAMRDMEDASAPLAAFVRDHCTVGPDESVPPDDLLEAYNGFANARGYSTHNKITFGRELGSVASQITRGGGDGART
jgi:putative DNA primase/helicase